MRILEGRSFSTLAWSNVHATKEEAVIGFVVKQLGYSVVTFIPIIFFRFPFDFLNLFLVVGHVLGK